MSSNLIAAFRLFHHEESGQDLIEYALIAALIALAAIIGMQRVASNINNAFSYIGSKLQSATPTS